MDVRERFLLGVDFIEEHLLEPVALADVAARAGLSLHYFSRLFRVLTGEPFGTYLCRRRLTVAAERLSVADSSPRLIELAFDCQYASQEAFTRAFKRAFGVTPGAFRERPQLVRLGRRRRIDAETLHHLTEVLDMEPEIREIKSFVVVGVRERFDEESKHGIPALWGRFVPRIPEIASRRPDETFGICTNASPESGSFDYIAGVAVENVDRLPEGLVAETIPSQTYAVFKHHVRSTSLHEELQPTMRWIWGTWLPSAPYEYVPGPDFERYPPEFDPRNAKGFLEICIPVRRKS
jgi:AraC family transcriptional regulator